MDNKVNYQIGLDLGSGSIGWAVIGDDNKLIKKRGKNLWGVRLFDQASTAKDRRTKRSQRKTINKRSWRLFLLRKELESLVLSEDAKFYRRLDNSIFKPNNGYFLFDGKYNDTTYHREFPTIYHLRLALMDETKVKEYIKRGIYYRLLFLAVNDIYKSRGHFLSSSELNVSESITKQNIIKEIETTIRYLNELSESLDEVMIIGVLNSYLDGDNQINMRKRDPSTLFIKSILGYEFDFNKIVELTDEKSKISFDNELWEEQLGTNDAVDDVLMKLYNLYSSIRLFSILGEFPNLSASKVKIYEDHKKNLKRLKADIKTIDQMLGSNYYFELFDADDEKKISYSTYVGKVIKGDKKVKIKKFKTNAYHSFINYLISIRDNVRKKDDNSDLLKNVDKQNYLYIPTNADNRLIPYQIHYNELKDILNVFIRVSKHSEKDIIKANILKVMAFKVPYYVGPLSNHSSSNNYWLVKHKEYEDIKVTPYNFDHVVDKKATNEAFIKRMLRSCTYLYEEPCIQQETILYQDYIFYNTVNKVRINDTYLTKQDKELLYNHLVEKGSINKKTILSLCNKKDGEITRGFSDDPDKPLTISLSAVKKFRKIFPRHCNNAIYQCFYDDVVNETSFIDGEEVQLKRDVIKSIGDRYKTINLTEEIIDQLITVKSQKWGNLSYKLLNEVKLLKDENTGELATVISILKDTNLNLIEILYTGPNLAIIDRYNNDEIDLSSHQAVHEYLKRKYISPQARRSIIQANRIVNEIVQIMGVKPSQIAIEFTRENLERKRETSPRLKELKKAYQKVSDEYSSVKNVLNNIKDGKDSQQLKAKKIYLYFLQLGKDIYTGKPIDFDRLLSEKMAYNIDHIFPRSRIKDDSIDNTVLTATVINGEMGNIYPPPLEFQQKNIRFWQYLKDRGLMSSKKFERLTRTTPLSDRELEDFVNRQKTTLDWVNVETGELLKLLYSEKENNHKFIIYSKSNHISQFRNHYELYKFRELNDFHHAHDAYLNIVIGKIIQSSLYVDFEGKFKTYNYDKIIQRHTKEMIGYIKKIFNYNDILVTKRTKINNKGAFWDELAVAPKKNNASLVPIKSDLDVKQFGGYNSVKIAFFTILEKNNQKVIEPIPVFHCDYFYDNEMFNLEKFERYIATVQPTYNILIPIIPIGQKVLINNIPMLIVGKSDNTITYHQTGQLMMETFSYNYLRKLIRFYNRNAGKKLSIEIFDANGFNNEDNVKVFNTILKRVSEGHEKHKIFSEFIVKRLYSQEEPVNYFESLGLLEQCDILNTIINRLLRPYSSNQGRLFGLAYSDQRISKNIKYDFKIIKESITGFYTKTIDVNVSNSTN